MGRSYRVKDMTKKKSYLSPFSPMGNNYMYDSSAGVKLTQFSTEPDPAQLCNSYFSLSPAV